MATSSFILSSAYQPKFTFSVSHHFYQVLQQSLTETIHQIQLIILMKPKQMDQLVNFYQHVLQSQDTFKKEYKEMLALEARDKEKEEFNPEKSIFLTANQHLILLHAVQELNTKLADFADFLKDLDLNKNLLKTTIHVLKQVKKAITQFNQNVEQNRWWSGYRFLLSGLSFAKLLHGRQPV